MPAPPSRTRARRRPGLVLAARAATLATISLATLPRAALAQAQVSATPATAIGGMGNGVSPLLDGTFMGFGIEPSNLLSFTGIDEPNPLSNQLLSNLGKYMGAPPHIRIGGNTGDNMLYDPSNKSLGIEFNPNAVGQGNKGMQTDSWTYGPGYYAALDNFPKKTPITFGLNLAYNNSDALDRIVTQGLSLYNSIKNVQINSLEVGNEPDLYISNKYRDPSWTTAEYGTEWFARAEAVYSQVLKPRGLQTDMFEAASTATTATKTGHAYRIANLMKTDVAKDNGQYLKGWAQHDYYYYVGVSSWQLTIDKLLNLPLTVQQYSEWTNQAKQANATGKPYFVREMGSVGPTGIKGISDTFANTLWTLNYYLFASTVGVASTQIHMTDNSYGSPWQPNFQNGQGPHVRSSYCAFAAMAQLLGTGCNTNIAAIQLSNVPSEYNARLAAYGVYRDQKIQAIVLLNTNPYGPNATYAPPQRRSIGHTPHGHRRQLRRDANQPSVTVSLSLPDLKGKTFYLSTLSAEHAASVDNTTWNGMEYESSGTGKPNLVNTTNSADRQQKVQVGPDGSFNVTVLDSQAVVANLGVVLGADDGHSSQCAGAKGNKSSTPSGFTGAPKTGNKLSTTSIIAIAAGAGGGAAFLAAIGGIVFFCMRRKKRRQASVDQVMADAKYRRDSSLVSGGGLQPYSHINAAPSREGLLGGPLHPRDEYALEDRPGVRFADPNSSTATLVGGNSSQGAFVKGAEQPNGSQYESGARRIPIAAAMDRHRRSSVATISTTGGDHYAVSPASKTLEYDMSPDGLPTPQLYPGKFDEYRESSDTLHEMEREKSQLGPKGYGAVPTSSPLLMQSSPLSTSHSDSVYSRPASPVDPHALARRQSPDGSRGLGLADVAMPGHVSRHAPAYNVGVAAASGRRHPNMLAAQHQAAPPPYQVSSSGLNTAGNPLREPDPYAPSAWPSAPVAAQRPGVGLRGYNVHTDPAYAQYARGPSPTDSRPSSQSRTLISPGYPLSGQELSPYRPISTGQAADDDVGMMVGSALIDSLSDADVAAAAAVPTGPSSRAPIAAPRPGQRALASSDQRARPQGGRQPERTSTTSAAPPLQRQRSRSFSDLRGSRDGRDTYVPPTRGVEQAPEGVATRRPRSQSVSRAPAQAAWTGQGKLSPTDTPASRQAYAEWYEQTYGVAPAVASSTTASAARASGPAGAFTYSAYPNQEAYNAAYHNYYAQYYEAQARAAAMASQGQPRPAQRAPQPHLQRTQDAAAPSWAPQRPTPAHVNVQHAYPPRNPREAVRQARDANAAAAAQAAAASNATANPSPNAAANAINRRPLGPS